jgi:hypothetical protein
MVPHLPYARRVEPPTAVRPSRQPTEPEPLPAGAPDLHTQLEAILDAVWKAEADWRFNDRLDMALKQRRQIAA